MSEISESTRSHALAVSVLTATRILKDPKVPEHLRAIIAIVSRAATAELAMSIIGNTESVRLSKLTLEELLDEHHSACEKVKP